MTTLRLSNQPRAAGKSGIMVSPLAWGMWRLAGDDVAALRTSIDAAPAWVIAHPARVTPIVGTRNVARIAAAAGACRVERTREQW